MLIAWIIIVIVSIYERVKKLYIGTPIFEEGYQYIILKDTELTKHPYKFSEGVFAWYENNTLSCSEEYQIENGGDPVVLKKFLLKSGTKKINL
jgi:hypothetical protein